MTLVDLLRALVFHHVRTALASRLPAGAPLRTRRDLILAALERGRPMHLRELAIASGQGYKPAARDVRRLVADGLVRRFAEGVYAIRRRP